MLTFEFENEKVIIKKESYIFTPYRTKTGDSDISLINMNGITQIQQKRVRNDGSVKLFGVVLNDLISTERDFFENLSFGKNKACISNPLKIYTTEENDNNGTYMVVPYDPNTHYNQDELNEDLDLEENFYKVTLIFISISN